MSDKKDRNLILKGIMSAKEAIKQSNFEQAEKDLKQIQPIVTRTKLLEFEYSFMKAVLFDKQEKSKECIESAKNAERLKPNDLNTSRLLIHSYILLKNDAELAKEISSFFEKHKNDDKQEQSILVDLIAPHLKDFDESHHEDITLPFIECLKKLPNYTELNIGPFIPETDDTVQIRCDLLRPHVNDDINSCSTLIELLLYEIPDEERNINEIIKLSKILPSNHELRLLIDTYFGPDPIKSAKLYQEVTSKDKFSKFIEAIESNNLANLKKVLNYENLFSSGWAYYGDQVSSLADKLSAYNKALASNPTSVPILQKIAKVQTDRNNIDDAIKTLKRIQEIDPVNGMKQLISFLISQGKGDEAEKYIGSRDSLSDTDKALLSFIDYEKSGDKNQIKFILDLPLSPQIAEVRARAVYELREEVGSKAQAMFAECLKQSKENGMIYLYFANWLDSQGLDEKASFIYEKCVQLGIVDDKAYDKVTQKLIKEDKLEEALQMCLKVNNSWSHFRAGLILQRQEKHELACGQLQSEITINPKNYMAWKALGQSYFILGRVMATLSVVQFLNENDQHDTDLEFQMSQIFEKPIVPQTDNFEESFHIKESPIPFFSFLTQEIARIKNLSTFGRVESCQLLIEKYEPFITSFQEKWGTLGAVLRLCGEFYLTSYKITKNQKFAMSAISFMKRRAEIDIRPETFIDLSSVLIEMGNSKQAVSILQKVVHKFPDNVLLWTNLGVAFALTKETIPFARHCLCVAAMIATDSEASKIYTFYSAIASMLRDADLANRAALEAERARPDDADVQLLKLLLSKEASQTNSENNDVNDVNDSGDVIERKSETLRRQLDLALLAFEYGPTQQVIANIPRLYLELNMPVQALGFSLLSNDSALICESYEALGKYETALTFAQDDATKKRLLALLGRDQDAYEAANFFNQKKYSEALVSLAKSKSDEKGLNSFVCVISEAVCLALLEKKEEATRKLLDVREKALKELGKSGLVESIERLILLYAPPKFDIGKIGAKGSNYQLSFLREMRNSNGDELRASKLLLKKNLREPNAYKVYLINALFSGYKSRGKQSEKSYTILENAVTLTMLKPSRETYLLLLAAQVKAKMYSIALTTLQKLCIMEPNLIAKSQELMKMLMKENANDENNNNKKSNQDDNQNNDDDNNDNDNQNNNDDNVNIDDDEEFEYDDDDE